MMRVTAGVLVLCIGLAADEDARVKKLLKQLKSEKAKERQLAASELAQLGSDAKSALKPLLDVLQKDSDAKTRAYAIYAIKQMGDDAKLAIPQIIDVLKKDKNEEVRCIVADTLGKFGTTAKEAVPALAEALKDKDVGPHAAAAL